MDRNSKVLIIVFIILVVTVVIFAYYRFLVANDYVILDGEEETSLTE